MSKVVDMFIETLLFAILMSIAFQQIVAMNTTGLDSTTVLLIKLVPAFVTIVYIIGLVYTIRSQ